MFKNVYSNENNVFWIFQYFENIHQIIYFFTLFFYKYLLISQLGSKILILKGDFELFYYYYN